MIDDCKYFAALLTQSSSESEGVENGAKEKRCYTFSNVANERRNKAEAN